MPKTLKLTAGELAETSRGQEVTVHAITGGRAVVQYRNNREDTLPVSELTPLGIKADQPIQVSAFRIPADLKRSAQDRASREGVTLTSVIVDMLTAYVAGSTGSKP